MTKRPRQTPQEPRRDPQPPRADQRHTLTPLRFLKAVAPSGGEVTFLKYGDSAERELSWYQGELDQQESMVFWRAKLKAERGGIEAWEAARTILRDAGWTVE